MFKDPIDWKYEAYKNHIAPHTQKNDVTPPTSVIAIGDKFNDIEAGLELWAENF